MFSKIATASIILFSPITLASASAQAVSGQCAALAETSYGRQLNASYSAHEYSEKNIGSVGVSIYPGEDLELSGFSADQLGKKLVSILRKAGVDAECFVNNTMFQDSGTAVSFKINGLSVKIDNDDSFNMKQIQADRRILLSAVNEAKTAKVLLNPK